MCHSLEPTNRRRIRKRKPKESAQPESLTLTDKAQLVLDWSWEIRDIVSLVSDVGVIVLVQHAVTGAVVVGVGSILIGILIIRLKAHGK